MRRNAPRPGESDAAPPADSLRPVDGIRLLPILHDRVESAGIVRRTLERLKPAAVALELPSSLAGVAEQAVRRLPKISVVISSEGEETPLIWVACPGDPLVEGLRWAIENGRPRHWVDPDLPYSERHRDPIPDPYAAWSLGPEAYVETLVSWPWPEASPQDRKREEGIAYRLQQARQESAGGAGDAEILCLLGAAHVVPVSELLKKEIADPFVRRRRPTVEIRHLDPESLTGLLPDAPLAHAVWETVRGAIEAPDETDLEAAISRPASIQRHGLRLITGQAGTEERQRRQAVVRAAAAPGSRPLGEEEREKRASGQAPTLVPDRRALAGAVWRIAKASYLEQTGQGVESWQRRLFFDFASRQARLTGQLAPGLFEWVISARGAGDDNLAWEVFDTAATYPWQESLAEIATATLDGDELELGTRRVRFRRRFSRAKRRLVPVPVRKRPRPEDEEELARWLSGFDSAGLCSYPPEDIVVEDYGRFLQKKAVSILSAERSRTEPFSVGLLDGVDIRETLRDVAGLREGKIWVRELGKAPGAAGSVVVIFDVDGDGDGDGDGTPERYPFKMTWLGEHDQESDMAFYSTDPSRQVVGPGIVRATYGGFMLSTPRQRLYDVWEDVDYRWARTKAEVLTLAAIDYSDEPIVVHVAAETPAHRLKRYAGALGRQLLHIPLASLSPASLKKIRVLHLLAGRDKRRIAPNYVW